MSARPKNQGGNSSKSGNDMNSKDTSDSKRLDTESTNAGKNKAITEACTNKNSLASSSRETGWSNEVESPPEATFTNHEKELCTAKNAKCPKAPRRKNSKQTDCLDITDKQICSTGMLAEKSNARNKTKKDNPDENLLSNTTDVPKHKTKRQDAMRCPSFELNDTISRQMRTSNSLDQCDFRNGLDKANSISETEAECTNYETENCTAKNGKCAKASRRRKSKQTDSLESSMDEFAHSTSKLPETSNISNETKEDNCTEKLPYIKMETNGQETRIQGTISHSSEFTSSGAVPKQIRKSKSEEEGDLSKNLGQANSSNGTKSPPEASHPVTKTELWAVNNGQGPKVSREKKMNQNGEEDTTNYTRKSGVIKSKSLKGVCKSVKLKKVDISKAAKKVNDVIDSILKSEITKSHPLFKSMERMSSGSYYENLKISKPNEFDIMLKITFEDHHTVEMTSIDESGAFYTLAFKRRKPQMMAPYTDDEGNILAKHILDEFRNLIKDVIRKSDIFKKPNVTSDMLPYLQKKEASSPAVTLIIPHEPEPLSVDLVLALTMRRWPEKAGTTHTRKYHREPCYMVSKKTNLAKKDKKDTWRVSFSNIEKKIMRDHGRKVNCCKREKNATMCCRKPCLKLMKHLLEQLKTSGDPKKMNRFCSYHAKTALLHLLTEYPEDEDWHNDKLDYCFNRYVEYFQTCLRLRSLLNFFVPSHNLFSSDSIDQSSCDYLWKELETQKLCNYPIFYAGQDGQTSLDEGGALGHD